MRLAASQVIERPPAEVFRFVAIEGSGATVRTRPNAGAIAAPGSTITIVAEPDRHR